MKARTASVLGIVLAVACASDEGVSHDLGAGCLINTDCASPLVCAFRLCHTACTTSRDCPMGQRCVVSDRPFHVCQLPDEKACVYNSDCPQAQICGLDRQCRDQCRADGDCVSEQVCSGGACADTAELVAGHLVAAGSDPSVDGGASGQSCLYNSECNSPLVCRDRLCTYECLSAADCPHAQDCFNSRCIAGSGTLIGPAGGVVSAAGRLKLTVPAGALRTAVSITMTPLEAYPDGVVGPVFEINPTGLTFDTPATLTYAYADAEIGAVPPAELRIAQAVGSQWTALPSTVDTTTKVVSASLPHLSVYGCLVPGGSPDGGAGGAGGASGNGSVDAGLDGRAGGGGTRITDGGGPTQHFPIPTAASNPSSITAGPDGNVWFTESNASQIGRITPSGTVTEFVLGMFASLEPRNIIAAPDGNLWFSTYQGDVASIIGRITPAGAVTTFQPQVGGVFDIAVGPDQNLWFTENYNQHIGTFTNQIGRLTPAGTITEFPFPNPTVQPSRIVGGPDALWFLESNKIARMTTLGVVTEVPAPTGLADIAALADGNIWFRAGSTIGRITPAGTQTNFPTPGTVIAFAVGPDQNLWFTRAATLGVITQDGTITETPLLFGPESRQFTWGPDGNLWFVEPSTNTIGRFAQP